MHLDLEDPDLDYIYRMLLTRPMGEVERVVVNIRRQIAQQQNQPTTALPNGHADQETVQ